MASNEEGFLEKAKKAGLKAAGRVRDAANTLEDQIKTRTGVGGAIADGVEAVANAATTAKDAVVKKGKELDARVQEQGGYNAVAMNAADAVQEGMNTAKAKFDAAYERVMGVKKSFEDSIFTEGQYDATKVRTLLANQAETTKKYGVKAYNVVSELSKTAAAVAKREGKKGLDKLVTEFKYQLPAKETIEKEYPGFATKYDGVVLRSSLEKSAKFYNVAQAELTQGTAFRRKILGDIKAYVVEDAGQLINLYKGMISPMNKNAQEKTEAAKKIAVVNDYLA